MAKNKKNTGTFGDSVKDLFENASQNIAERENDDVPVIPEPQPKVPPVVKEIKDRRVQLLTYGSLIDRMDAYAAKTGQSRAEVFEAAVGAYLAQYDN